VAVERTDPVNFAPRAKEVESRLTLKPNSGGVFGSAALYSQANSCAGIPAFELDRVRLTNPAPNLEIL
jgi:hypothetical protein